MATVPQTELQQLLDSITDSAKGYDEGSTVNGFESRANIRSAARDLLDAVTDPGDHVWQLVLQVSSGSRAHPRAGAQGPTTKV